MKLFKAAEKIENNINEVLLRDIQKVFPQAQIIQSINDAKQYVIDVGPKIVYKYIVSCNTLKQCSSVAYVFSAVASQDGFATLIQKGPGHYYNVMLTKEGALGVDFTVSQFDIDQTAQIILDNEGEYDKKGKFDPWGERRAKKSLLRKILKNPYETIRIWKMNYPSGYAPYKGGASGDFKLDYNEEIQKEFDPDYGIEIDPTVIEQKHPLPSKIDMFD